MNNEKEKYQQFCLDLTEKLFVPIGIFFISITLSLHIINYFRDVY